MTEHKYKHKEPLTDAQIQEKIGATLDRPQKASYLSAGIVGGAFLAWFLSITAPTAFKETGVLGGKILGAINLIWTLIVAYGWKTLPSQELKRLSKEQQRHHARLETIWFHVWRGGFIISVSIAMLLMGLGWMSVLGASKWIGGLSVSGYLLAFAISFRRRRDILRVVVEGWSAETHWGRLLLHITAVRSMTGMWIVAGLLIALARLHLLPENIFLAFAGLVLVGVADIMPALIMRDFSVAWIHLRVKEAAGQETGSN